jgi:hypothetical protein
MLSTTGEAISCEAPRYFPSILLNSKVHNRIQNSSPLVCPEPDQSSPHYPNLSPQDIDII